MVGPLISREIFLGYTLSILLGLVSLSGCGKHANASVSPKDLPVARATFIQDGSIVLPVGYREWSHVGTSVKFKGMNVLDGSPITLQIVLDTMSSQMQWLSFRELGNGLMALRSLRNTAPCEWKTVSMNDGYARYVDWPWYF